MRQIDVVVHHEGDSWWAESAQMPGYSALAATESDLRDLVREGVAEVYRTDFTLLFRLDRPFAAEQLTARSSGDAPVPVARVSFGFTRKRSSSSTNPQLVANFL